MYPCGWGRHSSTAECSFCALLAYPRPVPRGWQGLASSPTPRLPPPPQPPGGANPFASCGMKNWSSVLAALVVGDEFAAIKQHPQDSVVSLFRAGILSPTQEIEHELAFRGGRPAGQG